MVDSGFLQRLDFQALIDKIIQVFFLIIKFPLDLWNKLPPWVHYIVYAIILLFAILITWFTIRYRDAWKYRA